MNQIIVTITNGKQTKEFKTTTLHETEQEMMADTELLTRARMRLITAKTDRENWKISGAQTIKKL